MLTAPPAPPPIKPARRYLLAGAALVVGAILGAAGTALLGDSHNAEPETLTGTVNWSNQSDDMFSFQPEGQVRESGDDQVFYRLMSTMADYPACLAASAGSPVREDVRNIKMQAVHVETGGKQDINVALSVTCLN